MYSFEIWWQYFNFLPLYIYTYVKENFSLKAYPQMKFCPFKVAKLDAQT